VSARPLGRWRRIIWRCGPATRLTIRVRQSETEHTVSVGKFQSWLDGGGKSPNEQALKNRLRVLL